MVDEHNRFNLLTVCALRNCPVDANAVLLSARPLRLAQATGLRRQRRGGRGFIAAARAGLRLPADWPRGLPRVAAGCRWRSLAVAGCRWLSLVAAGCRRLSPGAPYFVALRA